MDAASLCERNGQRSFEFWVLDWQILNEKCGMWNELARREERGGQSSELGADREGRVGRGGLGNVE
jgi:hypothetical protein